MVEQDDIREDGIDAGGLFRDWMVTVAACVFSKSNGLCESEVHTEAACEYVRLSSKEPTEEQQEALRFAGRLIAMSLHKKMPLSVDLAPPLCALLLAEEVSQDCISGSDLQYSHFDTHKYIDQYCNADDLESVIMLDLFIKEADNSEREVKSLDDARLEL